ncbi:YheC/YheD family protein [Paenibacillus pasadenensis]|uniref:YheC/YheD family endospore coat-associated protein n=1 Tax=Paenibacillus pasadenensis TaxID=217090 RepID=UPI002041A9AF|nr:YheC/YheD family protein [Paenibacillus pasadenensis]MCM3747989.1 YheC/YheD family protein [Paenibacillus pasadenensis]
MKDSTGCIGVLIGGSAESEGRLKLPEEGFLAALAQRAKELQLPLYAFGPEDFNPSSGILTGYVRHGCGWRKQPVPLPSVVYDRCGPQLGEAGRRSRSELLHRLRTLQSHVLLNGWMPGKTAQFKALRRSCLAQLVPPTLQLRGPDTVKEAAGRWGAVFLKPDSGMKGCGVIAAAPDNGGWIVRGRDRNGRMLGSVLPDLDSAAEQIVKLVGGSRYIVQPQLPLSDRHGRPFDIRALVQKDARGRWRLTGTAMRRGKPGGIASNLYGGGEALPARDGLELLLGRDAAVRCADEIDRLAVLAADAAEGSFGRLAELGLDFGVAPDGRLWLLEMNSRPGRESFAAFPGDIARTAVERPLLYARLLSQRLTEAIRS